MTTSFRFVTAFVAVLCIFPARSFAARPPCAGWDETDPVPFRSAQEQDGLSWFSDADERRGSQGRYNMYRLVINDSGQIRNADWDVARLFVRALGTGYAAWRCVEDLRHHEMEQGPLFYSEDRNRYFDTEVWVGDREDRKKRKADKGPREVLEVGIGPVQRRGDGSAGRLVISGKMRFRVTTFVASGGQGSVEYRFENLSRVPVEVYVGLPESVLGKLKSDAEIPRLEATKGTYRFPAAASASAVVPSSEPVPAELRIVLRHADYGVLSTSFRTYLP